MNVLERFESVAQSYLRSAPVAFDRARGAEIFDENGNRYIDFQGGRGASVFGHNDPKLCAALVDYIRNGRIIQTRDRISVAKRLFVEKFVSTILEPRGYDYKILFTDPSAGGNAEIALRIARRNKKRAKILSFTNCFHGLTEGALAVIHKLPSRNEYLDLKTGVVHMPYCGYLGEGTDTLDYVKTYLKDLAGSQELPAAAIVEPVQVEGGMHIAAHVWLQGLEKLCREHGILFIVDETQTGFGRTGPYFAFEAAGLKPDIILMPNSIAGGLPLSMLLMRPELDQWRPGEEVGIHQGNNLAFIAAAELLSYWSDGTLESTVARNSSVLSEALGDIQERFPDKPVRIRGQGMLWGIDFGQPAAAPVVSSWAFERGLIAEPAWIRNDVLLITPPLTVKEEVLQTGLALLTEAAAAFLNH